MYTLPSGKEYTLDQYKQTTLLLLGYAIAANGGVVSDSPGGGERYAVQEATAKLSEAAFSVEDAAKMIEVAMPFASILFKKATASLTPGFQATLNIAAKKYGLSRAPVAPEELGYTARATRYVAGGAEEAGSLASQGLASASKAFGKIMKKL